MGVQILGDKETQRQLREVAEQILKDLPDALLESASPIKNAAKEKAPVITGALRDSIIAEVETTPTEVIVEIGAVVDYADDVEFGGLRRTAQPFLRNATDENEAAVLDTLVNALNKVIDDI